MAKKQSVILSFFIGKLSISPAGVVQFTSNSIESVLRQQKSQKATSNRLTEASLRGLDNASQQSAVKSSRKDLSEQKSNADRSINFMQKRQATANGSRRSKAQSVGRPDDIFSTKSKQDAGETSSKYFNRRIDSQRSASRYNHNSV